METIIKSEALRLGFSYCGIAHAESLQNESGWLDRYIKKSPPELAGYLSATLDKRLDPGLVLEDAKSVIGLLINYYPPEIQREEDNFIIAKYAYGADYHIVIKEKLRQLLDFLKIQFPGIKARTYVDTGPILEKAWAERCGLGWRGKNTVLINRSGGSFFFIGIILTNLDLPPDEPETDHCGTCTKCLDACPTGALESPHVLNPWKCISYLTIESKDPVPSALKDKFHTRIYGCDICQDVCPYNAHAIPHREPLFLPPETFLGMKKKDWIELKEEDFNTIFRDSPVKRAGYRKLMETIGILNA